MQENATHSLLWNKFDVFFHSDLYIIIITLIGMLGLFFHIEVLAIVLLLLIMSASWILSKDILPSFIIIAAIALIALRIPRTEGREGLVNITLIYYTPAIVIPSFIVKLIIHPFKFKRGFFFYPTLVVAIAVTLGGIFSISLKDYFNPTTLYYTFFLGVGMVGIYFVLERYLTTYDKMSDFLAKMMVGLGIIGITMLGLGYYEKYNAVELFESRTQFQWGNNLSNNLLLTMPFAFYLATKRKYTAFYLIIGALQFLALVFSHSRGGIIFGLFMFPFTIAATMYVAKGQRLKFITILIIFLGTFYLVINDFIIPFKELYIEIKDMIEVSSNEARANLYKMAFRNFLAHPMFGAGLGFDTSEFYNPKPMSMYWYHSTFFQVIGSTGLVGVVAYTYQELMRVYQLLRVKTSFNLFLFLSLVGFSGYSMVNVGYFVPIPFVAMLVTMFMVAERNNAQLKHL